MADRQKLPRSRSGVTTSFEVGDADGYMIVSRYDDSDAPGEVFLKLGKQGSTVAGLVDAFSLMLSLALQYGVPLETITQKLSEMRFEPMGYTDDPEIPQVKSIVDYVARRLALDFSVSIPESLGVNSGRISA